MLCFVWEICYLECVDYSLKLVKYYFVLFLYVILLLKVGKCVEILFFFSIILNSLNVVLYFLYIEGFVLLFWLINCVFRIYFNVSYIY